MILALLSKLLFLAKCHIPRPLPVGLSQFNRWVGEVVRYSGLPNNDSTRRLAATFIIQEAPPTVGFISIRRVANRLVKAAANQVALAVLNEKKDAI